MHPEDQYGYPHKKKINACKLLFWDIFILDELHQLCYN